MNSIHENVIRDKLVDNLRIIHPGLTFLDKEKYFPNVNGTRSFIDILARDEKNRFVLIELKRSNPAARQALHEVIKYINAIKENKSLREDELVLLIVSTEWKELLIPFTDFKERVNFTVEGYQLFIDENGNPLRTQIIEEKHLIQDRKLSDEHMFYMYRTIENRNKGIKSYVNAFKRRGIKDYIFVILDYAGPIDEADDGLKYMIYTSAQRLTNKEYFNIIKNESEMYEDYEEYDAPCYEDDDDINKILHGAAVYDTNPRGYFEYVEIGTPAKLSQAILADDLWLVREIIRGGRIKENELLSDQSILNELKGDGGGNRVKYKKVFSSSNKASLSVVKADINVCLDYNKIWLGGITSALNEISTLKVECECDIDIYNPSNTIRSLFYFSEEFHALQNDEGLSKAKEWLPRYLFSVDGDDCHLFYVGMLRDNGNRMNIVDFISKFYDGNESNYFMSFMGGGFNYNDVKASRGIGLEYANFKCKHDKKTGVTSYYEFDGFDYESVQPFKLNQDAYYYIFKESDFIAEIKEMFGRRMLGGGMVDLSRY